MSIQLVAQIHQVKKMSFGAGEQRHRSPEGFFVSQWHISRSLLQLPPAPARDAARQSTASGSPAAPYHLAEALPGYPCCDLTPVQECIQHLDQPRVRRFVVRRSSTETRQAGAFPTHMRRDRSPGLGSNLPARTGIEALHPGHIPSSMLHPPRRLLSTPVSGTHEAITSRPLHA